MSSAANSAGHQRNRTMGRGVLWLLILSGLCYSSAEVDVGEIPTDDEETTPFTTTTSTTETTHPSTVESTSDTWSEIYPGATTEFTTTSVTTADENCETSTSEYIETDELNENYQHDELSSSSSESDCDGNLSRTDMEKFAQAMMTFSKDLLKEVYLESKGQNVIVSPFSIALGLLQLSLGAETETEKKLLDTLHVGSLPCLHEKLHKVTKRLRQTALSIATRMYVKKDFNIKKEFLKRSKKLYGTKPVNLGPSMQENKDSINKWVSDATKGKITNFLSSVPANVVLMLLNAIYFKGTWNTKFDSSKTSPDVFYIDNENTVMADMMYANKYPLSYYVLDKLDSQVARLTFKGNMSFVIVMPHRTEWNISTLLDKLNKSELYSRFHKEKPTLLKFPKLSVKYKLELNEALTNLGLGHLFSHPDLRGISDEPLVVSSVDHQSTLDLNEEGVEAAGATAISTTRSLSTFSVNRPFLFMLFDDNTSLPLFIGCVRNPKPNSPKSKKDPLYAPELKISKDSKSSIPK